MLYFRPRFRKSSFRIPVQGLPIREMLPFLTLTCASTKIDQHAMELWVYLVYTYLYALKISSVPSRHFLSILFLITCLCSSIQLPAQNSKITNNGISPVDRTFIGRPWEYDTLIYVNEDSVCHFIIPLELANEISHAKTYFQGDSSCKPVEFLLKFYDDLGNMLFRTTDVNQVWDFGPYMMDEYTWILVYRLEDGEKQELSGTVIITE